MNIQQYKNWLNNPVNTPDDVRINSVIEKYPYCMSFRLYKALQTKSFEDKSTVAILHPDRKHVSSFFEEKKKEKVVQQEEKIKFTPTSNIDTEKVEKEKIIAKAIESASNEEDPMQILQQRLAELKQDSSPKEEKKEETIIEVTEGTLYEPQPSVSLDELVEKFNKFPPSVSYNPNDFEDEKNYKDLGKSSLQEKTNIVSETLADLYSSQGAYDKAIKIYEALMVKHPEKNATFAKLIESLKEKKKS
jgi:tetratricopeptide (TPR) repeat protein